MKKEIDLEDDLKGELEIYHKAKLAFSNAVSAYYTDDTEAYDSYDAAYGAVCLLEEAVENLSLIIRIRLRDLESKM